jgi:hypothetical protein
MNSNFNVQEVKKISNIEPIISFFNLDQSKLICQTRDSYDAFS